MRILIDDEYQQYAQVRWAYNTPVIVIDEVGECEIMLTYAAAKRLYSALPALLIELAHEQGAI